VVASAERITRELDWSAELDLTAMVTSAWSGWQLRHP
jgi:UDP-glucose 4-epimerase